ncbi:MarR family transcriptional regulator [Ancylobacter defluvii]|uniref:MarR family transcriptional regulator n=1 Tax=Ancylobacter defluvii TaxID=1282440 RepID=A0A9W6JUX5_9HYPH|nr:MarR family transcriptional regulator [Ancylobacter defluvii]MBS7589891.1 MarR family transcriptional regulator [Ancylobacter defluvii]GLK83013.1 MarR family transcriptional regulator [Ancylobacter defluvii]
MAVEMRASQALRLLHELALAQVRDQVRDEAPDLSQRQLAILLSVYLESPPHTVRGLAARLGVTKPVITRALDTMGARKLLSRRRDEADRRNVIVQRTVEGALYLERLGDLVVATARSLPR